MFFFINSKNNDYGFQHDLIVNMTSDFVDFNIPVMSSSYKFKTSWIIDKKLRGTVGGIVDYININKLKNKTHKFTKN